MGTDIHGYVEIIPYPWSTRWQKIIDIEPLAQRNYNVFARLFGVRGNGAIIPAVAQRGIPEDADYSFFTYDEEQKKYIKKPAPGDNPTWIDYNEIAATQDTIEYPEGWKMLVLFMFYLNGHFTPDEKWFDEEQIGDHAIRRPCYCRLVVWFDN